MPSLKEKQITIIGVGRLGLCAALCLEKKGFQVLGVDIFQGYVDALNAKTFKSDEPLVTDMLQASKNFRATTSMDEALAFSDVYFVLVDTPSAGGERVYDHSKLSRVLSQINDRRVSNKHIVIGCTVLPGYIHEVATYIVKDCTNTTVSYNPEFIAQGDIVRGFMNPDMVLIGEGSREIGDLLEQMYRETCDNRPEICRMSPSSAEITKLSINCFITTKISFANMVGDIADRTEGADKFAILHAVGCDSRIGGKYLKPGFGFGGPCFPRDNRALGQYAQQVGVKPLIPTATDDYNLYHAEVLAEQMLAEGKEEYHFSEVTYKQPCAVPIIEESHKLRVARLLVKAGKRVVISDRKAVVEAVQREYGRIFQYQILPEP